MLTRRKFLGSLAGLTAITALAGAGIRLPRRVDTEVEVEVDNSLIGDAWYIKTSFGGDFDTANLRYKAHERWSNNVGSAVDFSEKSLNDMLRLLLDNEMLTSYPGFLARPNKLIVPPRMAALAQDILSRPPPSLLRRFTWWLFPEAA